VYGRAGGFGVTARDTGDGAPALLDAGQNPPSGVVVHYYFREKPAAEVKLAFLDAKDGVIREFSSKETAPARPTGLAYSLTSDEQHPTVPAERGANRFVWNMRLPGAREVPDAALWFGFMGGPVVLPGTYTVRLAVGRDVLTKPFEIVKDTRLDVPDRALQEQFRFLLEIRDTLSGVNGAVVTARQIREQVTQWVARAEGLRGREALAGAARELSAELDRIEDALIQWRAQAYEDVFHFPVRLNNQIATIADLMSITDGAPTRQARELFDELRGRANTQLERLAEIKKGGVAMFSDALQKLGVPPIKIPADE
jgi:hypothetical protein